MTPVMAGMWLVLQMVPRITLSSENPPLSAVIRIGLLLRIQQRIILSGLYWIRIPGIMSVHIRILNLRHKIIACFFLNTQKAAATINTWRSIMARVPMLI